MALVDGDRELLGNGSAATEGHICGWHPALALAP
jgi:hypothetical protein